MYIRSKGLEFFHKRPMQDLWKTNHFSVDADAIPGLGNTAIPYYLSSGNFLIEIQAFILLLEAETLIHRWSCGLYFPLTFYGVLFPVSVATSAPEAGSFDIPIGQISAYLSDGEC